tara:strand:- start:257 stop:502 length:246 start_codon:yes stop_codon:yes gene_type:complete
MGMSTQTKGYELITDTFKQSVSKRNLIALGIIVGFALVLGFWSPALSAKLHDLHKVGLPQLTLPTIHSLNYLFASLGLLRL